MPIVLGLNDATRGHKSAIKVDFRLCSVTKCVTKIGSGYTRLHKTVTKVGSRLHTVTQRLTKIGSEKRPFYDTLRFDNNEKIREKLKKNFDRKSNKISQSLEKD